MSGLALNLQRNKRSLALDLKTDGGRQAARAVVDGADVVVTNMRRATLERLGLDPVTVRAEHPGLIYCVANGFGSGGPCADSRLRQRHPGRLRPGVAAEPGGRRRRAAVPAHDRGRQGLRHGGGPGRAGGTGPPGPHRGGPDGRGADARDDGGVQPAGPPAGPRVRAADRRVQLPTACSRRTAAPTGPPTAGPGCPSTTGTGGSSSASPADPNWPTTPASPITTPASSTSTSSTAWSTNWRPR